MWRCESRLPSRASTRALPPSGLTASKNKRPDVRVRSGPRLEELLVQAVGFVVHAECPQRPLQPEQRPTVVRMVQQLRPEDIDGFFVPLGCVTQVLSLRASTRICPIWIWTDLGECCWSGQGRWCPCSPEARWSAAELHGATDPRRYALPTPVWRSRGP